MASESKCCGGGGGCKPEAAGSKEDAAREVIDNVKEYYGSVLQKTGDLRTSACVPGQAPPPLVREALRRVPEAVSSKYYGCGNAVPAGIEGLTLLDLGCGSGQDCYVASQLVGASGSVIGVDMTESQLATARENADAFARSLGRDKSNMRFVQGYIEKLGEAGVEAGSVDLCISNCVVNLSPDKRAVIRGVYEALREGGEFYFSDVYCTRRLPPAVRQHKVLYGECISGALYEGDFLAICREAGFLDPREVSRHPIDVTDPELAAVVGNARFYSITYRLFKLPLASLNGDGTAGAPGLEPRCEDYGEVAVYKGTLPGAEHGYTLDAGHRFETGRPALVCGNTASMLSQSWLAKHFEVRGDRSTHYGLFDCAAGPAAPAPAAAAAGAASSGGCC